MKNTMTDKLSITQMDSLQEDLLEDIKKLQKKLGRFCNWLFPKSSPKGIEKVVLSYKAAHGNDWFIYLLKAIDIIPADITADKRYDFLEDSITVKVKEFPKKIDPLTYEDCDKLIKFLEADRKQTVLANLITALTKVIKSTLVFFMVAIIFAIATAPVFFGIVTLTPGVFYTIQGYVYLFFLVSLVWYGRKFYVSSFK